MFNFNCVCGYDLSQITDIAVSSSTPQWYVVTCSECQRIIKVQDDSIRFYIPKIRSPSYAESSSIWNVEGLDYTIDTATPQFLVDTEARLGVQIPEVLKKINILLKIGVLIRVTSHNVYITHTKLTKLYVLQMIQLNLLIFCLQNKLF